LVVGDAGTPALTVVLAPAASAKEQRAADWVRREARPWLGREPAVVTLAGTALPAGPAVLLGVHGGGRPLDQAIEARLASADRALLADGTKTDQAYVLIVEPERVLVLGRSDQGTLYGAMTLVQMFAKHGAGRSLPCVAIRDWPDYPVRVAENWTFAEGRDRAGSGWCYDWGDGAERYVERVERVFDRCLRYKINAIMFHGDFYQSLERMWGWQDLAFTRALNQAARQRGIRLVFGGLGVGGQNRLSYPDGPVYECVGYPLQPPRSRTGGSCRSNEALNATKRELVREFVRQVEPGALYVHHEDLDSYRSTAACWQLRCAQCRERWPDDTPESEHGAAAGFAHGYNQFLEAVFSVRNEDSGYDAARDCLVVLVSPGYTSASETDADWDRQVAYWTTVSRLLRPGGSVNLCIREQFRRADTGALRVAELARALRERGGGQGVFVFSLSFTSLYCQGPLFQAYPAIMNPVNAGAETVYFMSGTLFQEPLILLNAEAMWNQSVGGAAELPATGAACQRLFGAYAGGAPRPPAVHGPDGLLRRLCRELYGDTAGQHLAQLYELSGNPICFGREVLHRRSAADYNWAPELEATREAQRLVTAALAASDVKPENCWILERFREALGLGERFAALRVEYAALRAMALTGPDVRRDLDTRSAAIAAGIAELERAVAQFPTAWVTPRGGDFGYWPPVLAGMRRELADWQTEARALVVVRQRQVPGAPSLLTNGDMEADGGWRFETSPGAGYRDGGFVNERAHGGRRSYGLIHPPATDNVPWPAGRSTEWAQIVQEVTVEPGRPYVLVFSVYNNYGGTSGYLEHQVHVDEQQVWALDASTAVGWRTGSAVFVPRTARIRLALRTADRRWTGGWYDRGNSWWDDVQLYPARPE